MFFKSTIRSSLQVVGPIVVLVVALCLGSNRVVSAEDVARVARGRDGKVVELAGKVLEFDRDALTIKLAQQQPKVIPFHSILDVETPLNSSHESGRRQLENGNSKGAVRSLGLAFQRERRDWVRQQVQRDLSLAYRYSGDLERSASTALKLYRDFPRTNQFDALPLSWGVSNETIPNDATQWIKSELPLSLIHI